MIRYFSKGEASIFAQLTPDSSYQLVTCSAAGNVEFPAGDVSIIRVPHPSIPGRWMRTRVAQGEGDAVTMTITRPFASVADLLLSRCPMNVRLNFACAGEREVTNYSTAVVLIGATVTSRTLSEPITMEPSQETITAEIALSAASALMWDTLRPFNRTPLPGGASANWLHVIPEECGGDCGVGHSPFSELYATAGNGNVYRTDDSALSWTTGTVNSNLRLNAVITSAARVIAVGDDGETPPAGIAAYSDDFSTWSVVNVPNAGALYAVARDAWGRLFAVGDGGVFMSANRGLSWSRVLVTSSPLRDVTGDGMTMYAVGDSGLLATGRGEVWTVVPTTITDNFTTCDVNSYGRVIIAADDGSIYRYYAGIEEIGNLGSPITRLRFVYGVVGMAVGPSIRAITEDGGVSWYRFGTGGGTALVAGAVSEMQPRFMVGGAQMVMVG